MPEENTSMQSGQSGSTATAAAAESSQSGSSEGDDRPKAFYLRCYIGGLLMGVANLVPGISGGAMLLLLGVYTRFLDAVASITTFRWRFTPIATAATVVAGAGTSILLLAGPVKHMIVNHRFETFSLFIGMRLGVIPMVWKLGRPATPALWTGMAVGLALTAASAATMYSAGAGLAGFTGTPILFLAGLLGGTATVLPGLDGSYVLMLLGQYVTILAAIDDFKNALTSGDVAAAMQACKVLVPVGLGVCCGLGGVSLVLRWLIKKYPKPTFGMLLGILLGAFVGLYPFAESRPPVVGDIVKGVSVTAEQIATIEKHDWPLRFFTPTLQQGITALAICVVGFFLAIALSRLDPETESPAGGK